MPNLRSTQILLTVCYREMTVSKRNFSVRCAALCYATLATTSIGGDTKAAARQSPNCIWRITIFNMADRILTLCNVARTWHEMLLNSPKCPPYWNSTSGFDFDHIIAVDMSFCISLRNFIQIGPPSAKNDVMSIFKMADVRHLGCPIMGSLRSPCTTSYRSAV